MTVSAREPGGPRRRSTLLGALIPTVAAALLAACAAAQAASVSPLPRSDYMASPVCPPPSPGHAGCLSLELVPTTGEALAHTHPLGVARITPHRPAISPAAGSYGLRPQDLHSAYQLPTAPRRAQTIAIVDAYNDPTAEADLRGYDQEFGLLECTAANGCLRQVNQNGEAGHPPFPKTLQALEEARNTSPGRAEAATGWGLELSLDMETARATCQTCKILLVLANSESNNDLEAAERAAETLGANEITNSWGGLEEGESASLEATSPFNHPETVITASAGDNGFLGWDASSSFEEGFAEFPASSPHVVAVGGTRLTLGAGGSWSSETVWNGNGAGGGGCSVNFADPAWQQRLSNWSSVGCGDKRAVSDVSADADPYSGLAVHYSSPACEYVYEHAVVHWCTVGGTSLSSPLIAAVFALAGGASSAPYPARTLYENQTRTPAALHDIQTGSNGSCPLPYSETGLSGCTAKAEAKASCEEAAACLAGAGYDGPTGVGTPDGIAAFQASSEGGGGTGEEEKGSGSESGGGSQKEGSGESGGSGGSGGSRGSGGSGGSGTGPVAGAGSQEPPAGGSSPPSQGTTTSSPTGSTTVPAGTVLVSNLSLTTWAAIALNTRSPRISKVGFVFTSSAAASVRVTLSRRRRVHRRMVWAGVSRALTISVPRGRSSRRLPGRAALPAGLYRLTLTPARGPSRSLLFQLG